MNNELKPYDEYKDTDLLWLDTVPSHWNMIRNKNVLKLRKVIVGQNHGKHLLLSLTKQGIIARDMENAKGKFPKEFDTYQIVNQGNMVFCLFDIDETPRTVGLSSMEGMITGAYTVFKVENINEKYLYYYYLSLDNNKKLKPLYTGLRKVINTDTFLRTKMPIPPRDEQDQIVKYLDHQLAKINKFIKAKKKLIAALKEQKQAVINEAVTKGINPKVKMKPSGIEWLGDIPEHWQVRPLKHFVKSNLQTLTDSFSKENTIKYIDISTVGYGELKNNPVEYKFKDAPSRARRVVHYGDTIISTVRTYLKSMCFIDKNIEDCIVSTGFAVLTPNKSVYPKLLNYILSSFSFVNRVSKNSIGVSYPAINESKLISLKIVVPDTIQEQQHILDYITKKTKLIDKYIEGIEKKIVLIAEYRTSLISDVVTGKVDVRNIKLNELQNEEIEFEEADDEIIEGEEDIEIEESED